MQVENDSSTYVFEKIFSQISGINTYKDNIEQVIGQANQMSQVGIFAKKGSYNASNIEKTKKDYTKLLEVTPEIVNEMPIEAWINYSMCQWILLIWAVVFIFFFMEERKKGLWSMIHMTREGRYRLAFKRLCILISGIVIGGILLQGSTWLLAVWLYGACDLTVPIVSITSFKGITSTVSIGTFLLKVAFLRVSAIVCMAVIIWTIFCIIRTQFLAVISVAFIGGVQFLMYHSIGEQSPMEFWKYCNVASCFDINTIVTDYKNVNVFGYAIGREELTCMLIMLVFIVGSVSCIVINGMMKPIGSIMIGAKIEKYLRSIASKIASRCNNFGIELYKILFVQKGIVVVIIAFVFIWNISKPVVYNYDSFYEYKNQIYSMLQGEWTEQKEQKLQQIEEEIKTELTKWTKEEQLVGDNKGEYDAIYIMSKIRQCNLKLSVLNEIREQMDAQKGMDTIWLVNPMGYHLIFGDIGYGNSGMSTFVIISVLVILFCGTMAYEKQSNMVTLLHVQAIPNNYLMKLKKKTMIVCIIMFAVIAYSLEWYQVYKSVGMNYFQANASSIPMFQDSLYMKDWTIFQVLLCIYILRLFLLVVSGFIMLYFGTLFDSVLSAVTMGIIVFIIPSICYLLGLGWIFKFSILFLCDVVNWIF